ncbi:MAG TPA: heavy metal-binding domain-containing protein [Acidimicrobiales bacterium]|nr:heavy metal-binding domain-containing protein [Acidimicrobiales bacterium]
MTGPSSGDADRASGAAGSVRSEQVPGDIAFHPDGRERKTWTSDLSVAEAAAVRRVGMIPKGFVMGTAVMQLAALGGQAFGQWGGLAGPQLGVGGGFSESYPCAHSYSLGGSVGFGGNVGPNQEHYGFSIEDTVLAASLTEGYRLALERLHDEAIQLGAHGVVGVALFFENLVGSTGTATFFARGTAVVHGGTAPLPSPFLTNASGQHFERLIALGYVPSAMAVGVGSVYVQPNCQARGDFTVPGVNRQIPAAISVARSRARAALAAMAHRMGEGVVHTEWTDRRVSRYAESWDQLAVAVGTAVRRYSAEALPVNPRPVLPLRP